MFYNSGLVKLVMVFLMDRILFSIENYFFKEYLIIREVINKKDIKL